MLSLTNPPSLPILHTIPSHLHLPLAPNPDAFTYSCDCQIPYQHSGIGLETALQFAAEGARLVLGDINHEAILKAAALVKERFPTSEAIGLKCDVSKEDEVKALVQGAVDEFGRLDVLVSYLLSLPPTICRCHEMRWAHYSLAV